MSIRQISELVLLTTFVVAQRVDVACPAEVPQLTVSAPAAAGMSAARLAVIDDLVAEGIAQQRMPGCVVVVGRQGHVVHRKAYGLRQVAPAEEEMTVDTIFDLASLTKPVATATSVLLLIQDGRLQLEDHVSAYLPEFAAQGKAAITIEQLLTHQGGLIADNPLRDYFDGPQRAWERICQLEPLAEPGTMFVYSDVGFVVLGQLVQRVSGQTLDVFARQRIFEPLQLRDTAFRPGASHRKRCAPTEQHGGEWLRGVVHDPRARELGGVAGHAGLFSTADDLARYGRMLLSNGRCGEVEILRAETVELMHRPRETSGGLRGLGWDMRSVYSSNRGDLFTPSAFGHGGFTGTALWIDPGQDLFVIFLSNRLHPDGMGVVNTLAGRIATIAGAAVSE